MVLERDGATTGSGGGAPLVSVVIPAFNAASTLRATLDSALEQTHAALEIVVVNDGSTDATESIAREYSGTDPRIRVISTLNRGVAAARNRGIAASSGEYIAPLDADDLWHPEKIARQLRVMAGGGPGMGLVYTGFRTIDADGAVMDTAARNWYEGNVFLRSVILNLVGNGSGLLVRREALEAIGGYTEELRRRGVEGTEDRLVQCLVAHSWTVGVVPGFLVGYRKTPSCMSADQVQMSRSQLVMLSMLEERVPEIPGWVLDAARAITEVGLARNLMRKFVVRESAEMVARAIGHSPGAAAREVMAMTERFLRLTVRQAGNRGRRLVGRVGSNPGFLACDPDDGSERVRRSRHAALLVRLTNEETAFAATGKRCS